MREERRVEWNDTAERMRDEGGGKREEGRRINTPRSEEEEKEADREAGLFVWAAQRPGRTQIKDGSFAARMASRSLARRVEPRWKCARRLEGEGRLDDSSSR